MATVSYKKLWHLLVENNMTKADLQRAIKCSSNTIGKMNRNEYISMKNLLEICELFNCQISDIVTIEKD
ncbi:helix-turn-helix transcriptional regulator [Clostridium sp. HBUAS56010]|uniref:helix-turn-helix domain-containing protein n=1 Tax=Clostridium sp. HBUAS56010 TaxID=2571127 RepID=UPI001FA98565|nr:helix-turn-helix transcriptional regulator [Clostridium sp. HBUAS56010]